jgi:hypothetical protein
MRMIATETKMWERLKNTAAKVFPSFQLTRIESDTGLGISDVEYVADNWNGWIELKVTTVVRPSSRIALHCPFTMHQYIWLATHTRHNRFRRSWLLIGRAGDRAWKEWLLVPSDQSIRLCNTRPEITLQDTYDLPGVHRCKNPQGVLETMHW